MIQAYAKRQGRKPESSQRRRRTLRHLLVSAWPVPTPGSLASGQKGPRKPQNRMLKRKNKVLLAIYDKKKKKKATRVPWNTAQSHHAHTGVDGNLRPACSTSGAQATGCRQASPGVRGTQETHKWPLTGPQLQQPPAAQSHGSPLRPSPELSPLHFTACQLLWAPRRPNIGHLEAEVCPLRFSPFPSPGASPPRAKCYNS